MMATDYLNYCIYW